MNYKIGDVVEVIKPPEIWPFKGLACVIGTCKTKHTHHYVILVPKGSGNGPTGVILSVLQSLFYMNAELPYYKYLQFDYSHCSDEHIKG